jgi:hypothetical protein
VVLTSDPNRHSAIFCSFPRSCLLRSFICAEFTTVKWFRLLCTKTFFSFFKLPKQPNGRGLITQSKESRAFRFNAEMTQSLPGSRLCTLPHPSHCAACSKTASLLCWSGCAPHLTPLKCYRIAVFVLERGTHGLARLAACHLGGPSCQNPKFHFLLSGSPRSSSLQAAHQMCQKSQSQSYICHSQTRADH